MQKAAGLEYEIRGEGEPVLLIHGAHFTDSYVSLMEKPALAPYRLIRYRRRGYAGSLPHSGPFSIKETAQDARALLKTLDIERAHIVGHSSGGVIALQLALDAPELVHSLTLLEPALMQVPSAPGFFEAVAPAVAKYSQGDGRGAIHAFIGMMAGENWRDDIARMVPGGPEQADKDVATFFEVELQAVGGWTFNQELARQIVQPVLFVLGSESGPFFAEAWTLCEQWIPQTEGFLIEGANHLLHQQNPAISAEVARGMAQFFARHPMEA